MECTLLAGCPFFNDKMANMPATAEAYKMQYCKGDFTACARFMVKEALGKEKVPADLYPNQKSRAQQIIAQAN